MMTFNDYCNLHQCDKGNGYDFSNHYADFYDKWFGEIKEKVTDVCEIGVLDGASLKCYYDYFPSARILGLDINDKSHYRNDRVSTGILDQSNEQELINFADKHIGKFDILIDDGSHDIEHQQLTFGKLFKTIKPGGLYIIEDMGSSFFTLEMTHSYYKQTLQKLNNNTIKFLTERPFSSVWINNNDLEYINENIEYVSIFDKLNKELPYSKNIYCLHNYPVRSITSVIKKR